jgi:hypothetical protein
MVRWEKQEQNKNLVALKPEAADLTWEQGFHPQPVRYAHRPGPATVAAETGLKAAGRVALGLTFKSFATSGERSSHSADPALGMLFYNLFISALMKR